jgi:heme A synthase
MKSSRLATFAWAVLGWNVLVILWGAVVRATGSGAGCGAHWPLCNGQVIPQSPEVATLIEFFHRLTSVGALILVAALTIAVFRAFPKGHLARRVAIASIALIVAESLIGMLIVVQELTARNDSALRAVIIAVHQANTLLLLGAITLTGWLISTSSPFDEEGWEKAGLRANSALVAAVCVGVVGLMALGATGAITALGDTLFPATSLAAGLAEKFNPAAHFLVRLRFVHPLVASAMGVYIVAIAWLVHRHTPDPLVKWLAATLAGLFFAQCALGGLNVVLLAPAWMQLAHLLMADAVWICFVLLAANVLLPHTQSASVNRRIMLATQ